MATQLIPFTFEEVPLNAFKMDISLVVFPQAIYKNEGLQSVLDNPLVCIPRSDDILPTWKPFLDVEISHSMWCFQRAPFYKLRENQSTPLVAWPIRALGIENHFRTVMEHFIYPSTKSFMDIKDFYAFEIIYVGERYHYCIEFFHPYVLLLYRQFLIGSHPSITKAKDLIYTFVRYVPKSSEGIYFRKFSHWLIDYGITYPDIFLQFSWSQLLPRHEEKERQVQEYVYVVRHGQTRLVKIGYSSDPDSRLRGLQTSSPVSLSLAYVWKVPRGDGYAIEKKLHVFLEKKRQRGEWFKLSIDDEAEMIASMANYPRIEQAILPTPEEA